MKKRGAKQKYKFKGLLKGKTLCLIAENPHSCRYSAHYYAKVNGFKVKTHVFQNEVTIIPL